MESGREKLDHARNEITLQLAQLKDAEGATCSLPASLVTQNAVANVVGQAHQADLQVGCHNFHI